MVLVLELDSTCILCWCWLKTKWRTFKAANMCEGKNNFNNIPCYIFPSLLSTTPPLRLETSTTNSIGFEGLLHRRWSSCQLLLLLQPLLTTAATTGKHALPSPSSASSLLASKICCRRRRCWIQSSKMERSKIYIFLSLLSQSLAPFLKTSPHSFGCPTTSSGHGAGFFYQRSKKEKCAYMLCL